MNFVNNYRFYHQMLATLIKCLESGILTSPATLETFCRITSCQVDETASFKIIGWCPPPCTCLRLKLVGY